MELLKTLVDGETIPATATINRILIKLGLVQPRKRKRPRKIPTNAGNGRGRCSCGSSTSSAGYGWLTSPPGRWEAKVVTGVDDHSRFCVSARVVERATGRQVCLGFAQALIKYGIPDEALTDNAKQFTGRFGRGGEVLFDKICRHNGITHRLTEPASPTTTGKVSGSTSRCAGSCWTTAARSPRSRRRRPRWTPGSPNTTPTGPTRRWTPTGR